MSLWRRRPQEPKPEGEEAISLEDLRWRIGATSVRPAQPEGEPGKDAVAADVAQAAALPAPVAPPATPRPIAVPPSVPIGMSEAPRPRPQSSRQAPSTPHARPVVAAGTRRIVLWRDASGLLFGIVAIVLIEIGRAHV